MCKVLRAVEGPPHGFNDVYSDFEELWRINAGLDGHIEPG
jgi:hypothetical protein